MIFRPHKTSEVCTRIQLLRCVIQLLHTVAGTQGQMDGREGGGEVMLCYATLIGCAQPALGIQHN